MRKLGTDVEYEIYQKHVVRYPDTRSLEISRHSPTQKPLVQLPNLPTQHAPTQSVTPSQACLTDRSLVRYYHLSSLTSC